MPSWTETCFVLGIGEKVVGVTRYCVHPQEAQTLPTVGGTKDPDLSKIMDLQPDLVIACREENRREDILFLMDHIPVFLIDIRHLLDIPELIETLGGILHQEQKAHHLAEKIRERYHQTKDNYQGTFTILIWKKPLMTVGGDRYPSLLLEHLGLKNLYGDLLSYPIIEWDDLKKKYPQYLFLPSEPYPWDKKKHEDLFTACAEKTLFIEGSLLTWHGARTLAALTTLPKILVTVLV